MTNGPHRNNMTTPKEIINHIDEAIIQLRDAESKLLVLSEIELAKKIRSIRAELIELQEE